ncbi:MULTISPECIES: hypothetical protein [unclassified Streptomyces]|uniref:LexA family protein n=1 Tax=unclassified Streptomyces TaxID=2593676 RepID=UPI003D8FF1B1
MPHLPDNVDAWLAHERRAIGGLGGTAPSRPLPEGRGVVNNHLTERQKRILKCIRDWISEYGETPSVRAIGQVVSLSSQSSVAYQLDRMEQLGAIDQSVRRGRGRGISLPR